MPMARNEKGDCSYLPKLLTLAFLIAGATGAMAADVKDGPAAIKKAQYTCRLKALASPGQWQTVLVKNDRFGDEWHVWFGTNSTEPICGFYGAIVKKDGSYTSCQVSVCKPAISATK